MQNIYKDAGVVDLPKKLEIPKISDDELKKLYEKLKPIVTINDVKYLLREFSFEELSDISYIWERYEDKRDKVDEKNLEVIDDFLCLHKYGYHGLFKPSIKEVLAQMPQSIIEKANTFEIIEQPENADDLNKYVDVVNAGYHLSKVRAYNLHK